MKRNRFWWAPLSVLVLIALLAAGGWAIHRTAWTQGYMMGQLASGEESSAVLPYAPYALHGHGGLSPLLTLGLIILLIVVIGKILRFWAWGTILAPHLAAAGRWKTAGAPHGGYRDRHWRRFHGHVPPWWWICHEPATESAEEKAQEPGPEAATETPGPE
jgi:hypothetical protein